MALITPLRDGMNLVAKEFVACQDDDDPGVLILSPFAGAGGIMQEALQVSGALQIYRQSVVFAPSFCSLR